MVKVEVGCAAACKLIVDLEDPGLHVKVGGDKFSERREQFLLVVDVKKGNWCRHIS